MSKVKFQIDGYSIGGEELEGVKFDIILTDMATEACMINIILPDASYQSWYDEILDFVMKILEEELLNQFDYEILE